jgi:hypothetical protein
MCIYRDIRRQVKLLVRLVFFKSETYIDDSKQINNTINILFQKQTVRRICIQSYEHGVTKYSCTKLACLNKLLETFHSNPMEMPYNIKHVEQANLLANFSTTYY